MEPPWTNKQTSDGEPSNEPVPLPSSPENDEAAVELASRAKNARKTLAEYRAYIDRLKSREKMQSPPALEGLGNSNEALVSSDLFDVEHYTSVLRVSDAAKKKAFGTAVGLQSTYDTVVRHQLKMVVERHEIRVETVSDGEKYLRAETNELGPKGSTMGWSMLTAIIQLCIGCYLPVARVAAMLGAKISDVQIGRWLRQAAEWFLAIYLELAEQLAQVEILNADDSPTLVLEMRQKIRSGIVGTEEAKDLDPLVAEVAAVLGRAHEKVTSSEKKRVVQVSLISGRSKQEDPRSTINFYRTHYGDSGNLLSHLLAMRKPKHRSLTLQGDLSTRNLPNPLYMRKFNITLAGCSAHARRPLWRHREQDDALCDFMLRAFAMLAHVETRIDELGRTPETTLLLRKKYARMIWTAIIRRARSVTDANVKADCAGHYLWAPSSTLRKACRYIIRHEPKLTRYIDDPRLEPTNNRMERLLRGEVMLLNACKFRLTEGGRVVFDILRTIIMTVRSAQVPLRDYIRFVYQNRDQIDDRPTDFTPYAYRLYLDAQLQPIAKAG